MKARQKDDFDILDELFETREVRHHNGFWVVTKTISIYITEDERRPFALISNRSGELVRGNVEKIRDLAIEIQTQHKSKPVRQRAHKHKGVLK